MGGRGRSVPDGGVYGHLPYTTLLRMEQQNQAILNSETNNAAASLSFSTKPGQPGYRRFMAARRRRKKAQDELEKIDEALPVAKKRYDAGEETF